MVNAVCINSPWNVSIPPASEWRGAEQRGLVFNTLQDEIPLSNLPLPFQFLPSVSLQSQQNILGNNTPQTQWGSWINTLQCKLICRRITICTFGCGAILSVDWLVLVLVLWCGCITATNCGCCCSLLKISLSLSTSLSLSFTGWLSTSDDYEFIFGMF